LDPALLTYKRPLFRVVSSTDLVFDVSFDRYDKITCEIWNPPPGNQISDQDRIRMPVAVWTFSRCHRKTAQHFNSLFDSELEIPLTVVTCIAPQWTSALSLNHHTYTEVAETPRPWGHQFS
jgi:hypothetical protein